MRYLNKLCPALLAVWALLLVQCARQEEDGAAEKTTGNRVTISASLEQPQTTKTSLGSNNKVLWSEGDKIKVYNATHPAGVEYTLSSGAGSTKGEFSGEEVTGDGPFYAVYPASAAGSLSGESVTLTLPVHQKYAAAGSFGPGAAVSFAKGNSPSGFLFKNVLGGVSFSVSGGQAFSGIRLQTKGQESLSGTGTVRMSDNVPELALPARTSEDESYLYLDMPEGGATSASFCLMLPPGAFNQGFLVEFLDKDGNVMFRSAKATVNTVTRSSILSMPQFTYTPTYKAAFFESTSFGYFPAIGAQSALDESKVYVPGVCQYAYRDGVNIRYVRVQSLSLGFYSEITTPTDMILGQSYDVRINTLVGSTKASFTKPFQVLQKQGNRVWLVNEADHLGVIQYMED